MSRRRRAEVRQVIPDARYGDVMLAKFINCMMLDGRRSRSEWLVYKALELCEGKLKRPPLDIFKEVVDTVRPAVEVRSRRVGGATYQVPMEVADKRAVALAIRWLVAAARKDSAKNMEQRLFNVFTDTLQKRGAAFKKREDTHKMAEANKAFGHFKW